MKKVGIVMGSASDLPVVKKAQEVLESLGIPNEMHIYSAHRTPVEAREFAETAREKGFGVLIAAASPWPPLPWTGRKTRPGWPRRSSPWKTPRWRRSSPCRENRPRRTSSRRTEN